MLNEWKFLDKSFKVCKYEITYPSITLQRNVAIATLLINKKITRRRRRSKQQKLGEAGAHIPIGFSQNQHPTNEYIDTISTSD